MKNKTSPQKDIYKKKTNNLTYFNNLGSIISHIQNSFNGYFEKFSVFLKTISKHDLKSLHIHGVLTPCILTVGGVSFAASLITGLFLSWGMSTNKSLPPKMTEIGNIIEKRNIAEVEVKESQPQAQKLNREK